MKLPKLNTLFQLLLIFISALLFGKFIPQTVQATFYSISLTLKDALLFILPIIVFSCLFSSLLSFRPGKGLKFILILFIVVCISNYIATLIAYGVGSLRLVNIAVLTVDPTHMQELLPLWNIEFPKWISNNITLILGLVLGTFFSLFPSRIADQFNTYSKQILSIFFEKIFIWILPLFTLGFILKMQHDGILIQGFKSCLALMLVISSTYIIYLSFLFAIAAKFNFRIWLSYIKNSIPIALTGFSTMSSLATMPVTLSVTAKSTAASNIVRVLIPATVNIHMIGLAINIPLIALSILFSFGQELPSFMVYLEFALYFIIAQLAIAAAPGYGIVAMIPLLETYFNFTKEMSALIVTIYFLFDPIETSANVVGNNVLAIIIINAFKRFNLENTIDQSIPSIPNLKFE